MAIESIDLQKRAAAVKVNSRRRGRHVQLRRQHLPGQVLADEQAYRISTPSSLPNPFKLIGLAK